MRKKSNQIMKPGSADVGVALLSGDAFFRLAQEFLAKTEPDFQTAGHRAAMNLGELVASATNLALAIEIYLKALLLFNGIPAPKTHELTDLYSKLPGHVRLRLEQLYEELLAAEKEEGQTAAFAVHVTETSASKPNFNASAKGQDKSVRGVLLRCENAFVTWRYLFAHSITKDSTPLTYEFLCMVIVAKATRQQFGELRIKVGAE